LGQLSIYHYSYVCQEKIIKTFWGGLDEQKTPKVGDILVWKRISLVPGFEK
jgi:hypothetical protein